MPKRGLNDVVRPEVSADRLGFGWAGFGTVGKNRGFRMVRDTGLEPVTPSV